MLFSLQVNKQKQNKHILYMSGIYKNSENPPVTSSLELSIFVKHSQLYTTLGKQDTRQALC